MAEERFLDGRLVEVAFSPREVKQALEFNLRLRTTLIALRRLIVSEDFDGDVALALIDKAERP